MKKIIFILILLHQALYAQMPPSREGRGMRQHMSQQAAVQISPTGVMLFQYLGVPQIQQEYAKKVRQVTLTTKIKGNILQQKLAETEKRFLTLISLSTFTSQQQEEILKLLEEITQLNRELLSLQREAMQEIEKLNIEREKRILTLSENWLKKARKDPQELMDFIYFVQKRKIIPPLPIDNE